MSIKKKIIITSIIFGIFIIAMIIVFVTKPKPETPSEEQQQHWAVNPTFDNETEMTNYPEIPDSQADMVLSTYYIENGNLYLTPEQQVAINSLTTLVDNYAIYQVSVIKVLPESTRSTVFVELTYSGSDRVDTCVLIFDYANSHEFARIVSATEWYDIQNGANIGVVEDDEEI